MNIFSELRSEYLAGTLDESMMDRDPVRQFNTWMEDALASNISEPNAMCLSTVGKNGLPSSRMVLLKGMGKQGFLFFTNYRSRKGRDLEAFPQAALLFFWKEIERQVRIEGEIIRVSAEESRKYFSTRPLPSQVAAIISPQSEVIPSRKFLEDRMAAFNEKHKGGSAECPEHWGGFELVPSRIEFWQGRENRLHDRLLYVREGESWILRRLSP